MFRMWMLCLGLLILPSTVKAPGLLTPCQLAAQRQYFDAEAKQWADEYRIDVGLSRMILQTARNYRIEAHVAYKLIWKESHFDSTAHGQAGEIGLTQLMPSTAQQVRPDIPVSKLWASATNVGVGFEHLRWLLNRYGNDYSLALIGYNQGTVRADWLWQHRLCLPTSYIDSILGPRRTCTKPKRSSTST